MRLLIATDCYLPRWDGVARFLSEIVPKLNKPTIMAPDFGPSNATIKFKLFKIQFGDIYFSRPRIKKIKEQVKKHDKIFVQTIGPIGALTIIYAKKANKPVVAYVHSIDWELVENGVKHFKKIMGFITRIYARWLYNKCDLLLVPNKRVEDQLTHNKIKTKKELAHLGIPTAKFLPVENKENAKKRLNINPKRKVIGFVGRIGREKDLPTLVKAFQKTTNTKLLIVGSGITDEIPKERNIILAGKQDNVVPYYQALDVFVLPSLTETTSLSTLEAMSCGIPVICTPVGSIPEYVKDGQNGYLFSRGDSKTLARKINELLENPKKRKEISKNARKTVIDNYKLEDTLVKIKNILHHLT